MIPYFTITAISFGPFDIYVWGLMVGAGIAVALAVAYRRARRFGLAGGQILDVGAWAVAAGFIGARLGHVLFYDWSYFAGRPFEILKIWQGGMSSFGGFIGAALAVFLYGRIKKINLSGYVDAAMYAFPLGVGLGRLGCFFNHLHLGKLSDSFLAVNFPDGARLDMGLVESLFGFLLFGVYFFFLRHIREKIFLPLTMFLYGAARFVFDFYRATDITNADARYGGLTPAQYGSIILMIGGVLIWTRLRQSSQFNIKRKEVDYGQK